MRLRKHANGYRESLSTSERGHSLLEVIVATGIFVLISVALAGVWVLYGKALSKSAEVAAGNTVARSVTEGLAANGWEWLKAQENETFPVDMTPVKVERIVRGRRADILYDVSYTLEFNSTGAFDPVGVPPNSHGELIKFSPDLCKITVAVRWNSAGGGSQADPNQNSETTYSAMVYRYGI